MAMVILSTPGFFYSKPEAPTQPTPIYPTLHYFGPDYTWSGLVMPHNQQWLAG